MNTQQGSRFRISAAAIVALLALVVAGGASAASVSTNGLTLVDLTHPESDNTAMVNITGTTAIKGVGAAFDNDFQSDGGRWLVQSKSCWVAYEFETPTAVNAYGLWNSKIDYTVAARAPKDFQLLGSNDGVTWTPLDAQTGETGWELAEMRLYRFANTSAYKMVKFNVSANNGDTYTQLHELEFYHIVTDGVLAIEGSPLPYGTAVPAYGTLADAWGQTIAMSVSSSWMAEDESVLATCSGWIAYTNAGLASNWIPCDQGAGSSVSFACPEVPTKFAWQFVVSNLITAVASAEGSISGAGRYNAAESAIMTATPAEGYEFVCWTGDVPSAQADDNPLELPADQPRTISAVYRPVGADAVQYVAPDGSDAANGYFPETAKKTIAAAVAVLNNYGGAVGAVHVADGWYPVTQSLTVSFPIRIESESGDPSRVVVSNTVGAGWYNQDQRVFILNHPGAVLSGLTIANGQVEQQDGGNVWIKTGGGMVTNCVLDRGYAGNYYGTGAGIRMEAGLLTHSIIRRSAINKGGDKKASAIHASGGARISDCLVLANESNQKAHVVYFTTATMANCTVVGNAVTTNAGWVAVSADNKSAVVNTVIAGTTYSQTGAKAPNWTGTASVFQQCATDDAAAVNATCLVGTVQQFFRDYAAGDYRPRDPLIDKGASLASYPAFDLAGKPRIQGSRIDIGAFEAPPSCFVLIIR